MSLNTKVMLQSTCVSCFLWACWFLSIIVFHPREIVVLGTMLGMGFGMQVAYEANIDGMRFFLFAFLFASVGFLLAWILGPMALGNDSHGIHFIWVASLSSVFGVTHGVVRLLLRGRRQP